MVDVVGEKRAIRERVRASRRARSDEERRADDAAIADAAIALIERDGRTWHEDDA